MLTVLMDYLQALARLAIYVAVGAAGIWTGIKVGQWWFG